MSAQRDHNRRFLCYLFQSVAILAIAWGIGYLLAQMKP